MEKPEFFQDNYQVRISKLYDTFDQLSLCNWLYADVCILILQGLCNSLRERAVARYR